MISIRTAFFSPLLAAILAIVIFIIGRIFIRKKDLFAPFLLRIFVAGLIAGGAGLVLGVIGPIIFGLMIDKDLAQGPLLGILVTGPIGSAAGILYGAISFFLSRPPQGKK